jgi:glycosyltransferase involved in cell wall biosynthesis
LKGAARLGWELIRRRPDIVNFYLPLPFLIGAPMALLAWVPHIIMSRRGLNTHFERYPGARTVERWLHPHVGVFVANSRAVARQMIDDEGVAAERVALIHNGVELAPFDRPFDRAGARLELEIPNAAFVMIVVANLHAYKGHGDLLQALSGIAHRLLGPDWVLLLAGRDDGVAASLEAKSHQLGIARHVRFLGQRSDIPSLLRLSDMAIHCSYEEGSSNAVLEAMAAGLPLVVTDAGGNAEAVLAGINGLVVPPREPEALARAILRIVEDRDLASQFGKASRRRVETEYSLAVCLDKYERLYRSVLAGEDPIEAAGLGVAPTKRQD